MKRQIKLPNSLAKSIEYIKNGDNSVLREILFKEQKGFCSYTETYLGRTDQKDIDHFNPLKDYSERNSYLNLFLCKSQWNKEKSNKWNKFQPALSPLNTDFEKRISYNKELKLFEATDENDNEAMHLVKLLKLDDYDLSVERRKYIELTMELIKHYETPEIYFQKVIQGNISALKFIRSLEKEFEVSIWNIIPEIE
ncbi:HNH endonuclease domain-containing protein [Flavobacterium sp.]|uniref:HNH endonuclease domain-containing protein n=1 Tax=Flavobacterium sp. TaxID=239 RepID=UPI003262E01C